MHQALGTCFASITGYPNVSVLYNLNTKSSITYNLKGKIGTGAPDVAFNLTKTLNLNCPTVPLLVEHKAMLDTLIADIDIVPEKDLVPYCTNILQSYLVGTNPIPLCRDFVVIPGIAARGLGSYISQHPLPSALPPLRMVLIFWGILSLR